MKVKKINESLLAEETLGQAAADYDKNKELNKANKELQSAKDKKIAQKFDKIGDVEFVAWDGAKGEVEEALDRALENAFDAELEDRVSGDNVLLVGRAGTGKTERIKKWAQQRGLDLEQYQVQSLDPTDLAGIIGRSESDPEYASRLGNKEFHRLDNPNAILFVFVFPGVLLLGFNVFILIKFIKMVSAKKKVQLNELSDEEKEALRKELMKDLASPKEEEKKEE